MLFHVLRILEPPVFARWKSHGKLRFGIENCRARSGCELAWFS